MTSYNKTQGNRYSQSSSPKSEVSSDAMLASNANLEKNPSSPIKPLIGRTVTAHGYTSIYDCCVLIVHCPHHNRIAICNSSVKNMSSSSSSSASPVSSAVPSSTCTSVDNCPPVPPAQNSSTSSKSHTKTGINCPSQSMNQDSSSSILPSEGYRWFPYSFMSSTLTWQQILFSTVFLLLNQQSFNQSFLESWKCLNLFRLQLPRSQRFINRLIYYVRLNSDQFDPCNEPQVQVRCNPVGNTVETIQIEWYTLQEAIQNQIPNIWGPEVGYYALIVAERRNQLRQTIVEYSLKEAFSVFPVRDVPQNREEEMLFESKVKEKDMERIYDDFIEHCFPCFFMNPISFQSYMNKHQIELDEQRIQQYYNSFRFLERSYMGFHELLIGLVAIDKETLHCETRLKIIFRFYDENMDGYLDISEFRHLIQDLSSPEWTEEMVDQKVQAILGQIKSLLLKKRKSATTMSGGKKPDSEINNCPNGQILPVIPNRNKKKKNRHKKVTSPVNDDVDEAPQPPLSPTGAMGGVNRAKRVSSNIGFVTNTSGKKGTVQSVQIGFKTFFKAVKRKILIGTSKICRSNVWIGVTVARSLIGRRMCQIFQKRHSFKRIMANRIRDRCEGCVRRNKQIAFRLATHIVSLGENRILKSAQKLNFIAVDLDNKKVHPKNSRSVEIQFNFNSLPNLYISLIRTFNKNNIKGTIYDYKGLFEVIPEALWDQFVMDIESICKQMEKVLEKETRVVDLRSPIFVIGDIHGNLEDLFTLEQRLFPSIPFLVGNNFLFLGDYVDRGRWSFECAIYLFCLKLLMPNRVTLLRGNHEVRSVQKSYSYESELIKKYGRSNGPKLFEFTNCVFDRLPFGAIVDNAVFCAHGGIPYSALGKTIRSLNAEIPKALPVPEAADPPFVWEVLWSDPVEDKSLRDEFEFLTDALSRKAPNADGKQQMQLCPGSHQGSAAGPARKQLTMADKLIGQLYQVGYLPNRKRGTGYLFNEYAFGTFLAVNKFSHMIRAHEVPMEGYRVNFHTKCITVFSCSHYCGFENECATVLLQNNRIRVVQLDTFNNNPATD